jgi:glycosyltransferase involved in cell wall biosynthesis
LRSTFGEASAFDAGIKEANGDTIIYFAGRVLINPKDIPRLLEKLNHEADLAVGWRYPRRDWLLNRVISWVFNRLMRALSGLKLHDINSGIFVTTKKVLSKLPLYGDLNNFLPVLAYRQGYKVIEQKVEQMPGSFRLSRYPKEYLQRLLDIVTVLFLTNYSKKPLHFLGFLGGIFTVIGGGVELYLFIYRILGFGGIAGRPLLLLGAMLLVIGLQMISIGLIGEMIIFTHAKDIKEYNIAEIME